jgi:cyclopropane fatty-acyl-phospholipid synthase-like methyltransferase
MGLTRTIKRLFLGHYDGVNKRPMDKRTDLDAEYYQTLHEKNRAYQSNNWLVDQDRLFSIIGGKSVLELGCGNGRFTAKAAAAASHVYGMDWARSPEFDDSPENVTFIEADALTVAMPSVDVACSGDVLEHFRPEDVPGVIAKLHGCATANYHVIACYDDKHSHLTVEPKEWWLAQFKALDERYRLLNDGSEERPVAIVTNAQ